MALGMWKERRRKRDMRLGKEKVSLQISEGSKGGEVIRQNVYPAAKQEGEFRFLGEEFSYCL